jgi:hypothetical protein
VEKALLVEGSGSGSGYLRAVSDYVHLNPARARLLKGEERLRKERTMLTLVSAGSQQGKRTQKGAAGKLRRERTARDQAD